MTPALVMFAIAFMATGNAAISGAAPSHSTRTATATHHRHDHSKQRPLCFGQPATIVAHNGQTVVRGTSGRDVIVDPNVFAVIRGRAGNDLICGGIAESEDDSPVGDIIHGGPGNDRIDGRIGPDALFGGPGNDTIFGRAGDDTIDGGSGDDTVYGGGGDDTFFSGSGSDKITGGHADGSTENTIAFLRATGPVTVDLATGTAIGSNLIDSFTSINDVIGSPYADTITGNRHDNQLRGDCGDDEISGGKGDDQLNGDLGDFDFYPSCSQPGQTDNDTLRGDAGDDTFALSPGSADGSDRAFGGSGNDRFTSLLGHDELDGAPASTSSPPRAARAVYTST